MASFRRFKIDRPPRLYGSIDTLLNYRSAGDRSLVFETRPAVGEATPDTTIDNFVGGKLKILSTLIADIDAEIDQRQRLVREIIDDNRTHYFYLKTKLFALDHWPIGGIRPIEQRRSALEKQLDDLNKQAREARMVGFQDIAKLTTERRTWLKQYGDLLNRMRLLAAGG